ncbi:MAG TPA: 4Fe-4S dicluster domain-containing protein [Candidatus Acidoferrales bacterium]|nr:4Fe-4S dicluster domain-containing protein [Candidatus Acidoferrales bacterium]
MPFKTLKQDAADALVLEWVLLTKHYQLALDRNRCVGCQICMLVCPKAAISTQRQPKQGVVARKATIDIDSAKCNFCGACDLICPYGAIEVTQNGVHSLPIVEKESFPQLTSDIVVDAKKCDKACSECETACPLKLIKISKVGFDGQPVTDIASLSPTGKRRVQVTVDIAKQYCPTCRACEYKCKPGAINIKKTFEGKIKINPKKCPEDCHDCMDVCPITGTLQMNDKGKVVVDEQTCTYCGACKNVCPVEEALMLNRTKIIHTHVRSGAWNKALERLIGPENAAKEFTAQAGEIRRAIIDKRFIVEELKRKNANAC